MKPVPFKYEAPKSVDEVLELLSNADADCRVLAGGQSLVPMLALRLARPTKLIDLNRIPSLAGIRKEKDEIVIGAMTRQADALTSDFILANAPLVARALAEVGHPPTRARGTVGGSLCHADPAAELPATMVALDARFVIRRSNGSRTVAASDFFIGMFETVVSDHEILAEIRVPVKEGRLSGFVEVSHRKGDFAILSVAAVVDRSGDRCSSARVVLGGATPIPFECPEIRDALVGEPLNQRTISDAARALAVDKIEFETPNASRAYRQKVAVVLVERALEMALRNGAPQ